ncbi:MAG: DUF1800 domain-containing protein [Xanthomonadales bacterium]|nr:DUF1800 domain-containing protein [Xanthomonadales bacterium]
MNRTVNTDEIAAAIGRRTVGRDLGELLRPVQKSAVGDKVSSFDTHLLNRTTFGITDIELQQMEVLGAEGYLDLQLNPDEIDNSALEDFLVEAFPSVDMDYQEILERLRNEEEDFNPAIDLIVVTLARQLFSPRQLFEVMVEFWTNHFNVFLFDEAVQYLKTGDDRDNIRPHAMGRFRDLLYANAASPAMLLYLDNYANSKFGPNENYARELMELHTLGVDGGYTETDVAEVARCFTGWTIDPRADELFVFVPEEHDDGEKTVLGQVIPAGGGIEDGHQVLDILLAHPSTGQFLASKLVRRFVADEPPLALVERVAESYQQTDGDIRSMLRVIFESDEFADSRDGKFRRPSEYVGTVVRTLNPVQSGNYFSVVFRQLETLGQVPFFSVPPTGYPDTQDDWLNTNALLSRWNLGFSIAFGELPAGSRVGEEEADGGRVMADFFQIPVFELLGDARTPAEIVDRLLDRIVHQQVAVEDRSALVDYAADGAPGSAPLGLEKAVERCRAVLAALLASRYFQMR